MEKKVAEIESALSGLSDRFQYFEKAVQDINKRLDQLPLAENRRLVGDSAAAECPHPPESDNAGRRPVATEEDQVPDHSVAFGSFNDPQSEYRAIKESVAKVKLPPHLLVGDNRAGVSRTDLPKFNIIQRCARYQETVLKILSTSDAAAAGGDLATLALAQLRYLQEEYTQLIVVNQFDDGTAKLFQTLQQNPAAFPQNALENLQRAVTIAGARQPRQVSHSAPSPRGRDYARFGFRRGASGWGRPDGGRRPWAGSQSADWRWPPGGPLSRDLARGQRSGGRGAAEPEQ